MSLGPPEFRGNPRFDRPSGARIWATALVSFLALSLLGSQGAVAEGDGWLRGVVTAEAANLYGIPIQGPPIEGARVEALGTSLFAVANSTGNYNLTLPAGNYTISYSAQGFETRTVRNIKVTTGTLTTKDVILARPKGNLTGTVTDLATGKPVPYAIVSSGGFLFMDFTGTDGRYELSELEAGEVNVSYAASGYETLNLTLEVEANSTVIKDVRLRPTTGVLSGKVTNLDTGHTVPYAHIQIENGPGAIAESNGSYRIERIPPGNHNVTVSVSQYETVNFTVTIEAGRFTLQDIQLRKPQTRFQVSLSTREGDPIRGATVKLGKYTNITNESGVAVFKINESGTYSLRISHPGYLTEETSMELLKGDTDHSYSTTLRKWPSGGSSSDLVIWIALPALVAAVVVGAGGYAYWREKKTSGRPPGIV